MSLTEEDLINNLNEKEEIENENKEDEEEEKNSLNDIVPTNEYKDIKTSVIKEQMLLEEIRKHNYIKRETITEEFYYASFLSLENKNILHIQNLNVLKNLEELYLDNNVIEEIENLDALINLRVLSISNNKIKEIKNLESLRMLSELNLHNNQIRLIENLNQNKCLEVLVLSKNFIDSLQSIYNLQTLPNLKCLNLLHNPICDLENINEKLSNHLLKLRYFNNTFFAEQRKKFEHKTNYEEIEEEKDRTVKNHSTHIDTKNFEKKINDAYMFEVKILPNTLFDSTKEPTVLYKIENYEEKKNTFLGEIQKMNEEIINIVLSLNEERQELLTGFNSNLENFLSKHMKEKIDEYDKLKRRSKKTIRSILNFLNLKNGISNMEIIKYEFTSTSTSNESKILGETIKKKLDEISEQLNLTIEEELLNENETEIENEKREESRLSVDCSSLSNEEESLREELKDTNKIHVEKDKYIIVKKYLEKNIEENFLFGKKLINDELMNIVSLNSFIEKFKNSISKTIKKINDELYSYFRKLEALEQTYNNKILDAITEVKKTDPHQTTRLFNEEDINEFYIYKGYRSNVINNVEDSISSSYNKSFNVFTEDKKKHLFIKSRERIIEIEKIVNQYNSLFYSYLSLFKIG